MVVVSYAFFFTSQNLGTIKCSNLCTEIIEYTAPDETAVCNLASIALPRFVREKSCEPGRESKKLTGSLDSESRFFDFEKLAEVTRTVTRNLNRIIDINYYPVKTAEKSNLRHRPIGIGCQGLADAFLLLGMPFDSPEVRGRHQIVVHIVTNKVALPSMSNLFVGQQFSNIWLFQTFCRPRN